MWGARPRTLAWVRGKRVSGGGSGGGAKGRLQGGLCSRSRRGGGERQDPADGRGAQRPRGGRRGWEGEGGEGKGGREDEGGKEEEAGEKRGEEAQQGPTEAE